MGGGGASPAWGHIGQAPQGSVVLEGTGAPAEPPDRTEDAKAQASQLLAEGLTRREVVRRLSDTLGLSRNDAYRLVMELP